ncbi:hypothetical protein SAMN05443244_3875 [Terriglobus roseus]|uniref:Uncharacterized protein n=1 Tax=Terriglobus roseus TaxID=392734 RepID=A0A1H4TWY4_9BACT|nr:hypothetical protein SAMN05443244_3875 [Terriglobus roseus]
MVFLFLCVFAVTALPALIGTYLTWRRREKYTRQHAVMQSWEQS